MSDSVDIIIACDGELITYLPHGGVAKIFKALVERQTTPQVQQSAAGPYPVNQLEVLIPNDATNGVTNIRVRKDKILFKKHRGDSDATEFTVNKIIQEDAGMTAVFGGMFRVSVQA